MNASGFAAKPHIGKENSSLEKGRKKFLPTLYN